MIEIKNLTKSYGDKIVVNNLNVEIEDGKVVAFIGQNGAGKTTTLNMITGILEMDSGSVKLNGLSIEDKKYKRQFFYIFDTPDSFLYLTGMEYLDFLIDVYEIDKIDIQSRIDKLLLDFDMAAVINDYIESYSHGMRQKMMILGALLVRPKILILDEPLHGLDPIISFKLKNIMKEYVKEGNIVLFSTHVLEVAEKLCDSVVIIKKGEMIFNGSLDNLKNEYKDKNLEDIFLILMEANKDE
ncbi:ABC transporter ATP-binding protein [Oceanivirga salmonicida]|uniref:ABC transporter ATP-binding protein n=1 Tax=Oceanivirga salmonicida TaxID=1769291 RepID=UPI0012E18E36|nr:ABC transporter ATP-binding protein [Oceanivirga salmonicida]